MNIFYSMLPIAFAYSAPLIIAALGGLFSERSGVVNVALEGIMMVGGFAAATVTVLLEPLTPAAGYWGLLAGLVAGCIFSLLHAFASINLKADQVVSGTAINILAGGLTIYLAQIIFQQQRTASFNQGLVKIDIPVLDSIPVLGPLLFKSASPPFYIALVLVLITWFVVTKTSFGLRLRSCGENPQAAASMGLNVLRIRYYGVMLSGCLAGLAGSALVLTQDIQFTAVSIHGAGFIALACLIFGKWSPFGVLGAGIFFGLSQALSIYAKDITFLAAIPLEFFYLLPYFLTIVALLVFSGKSVGPRAAGEIYDAGKR